MAIKILIVDDEEDFAKLIGASMGRGGFEVEVLNDPAKAVERMGAARFDAVVMDLMMPGTKGMALVETVRGMEAYAKTPLFVLSAKVLSDEERKFLLSSKINFIQKPFSARQLMQKIREQVGV